MKIHVAIFEDNVSLLESLKFLISATDGFVVCGSFTNTEQLLEKIENTLADVILMDIELPGINGIEATALIKQKFPDIQILIQTVFEDDEKVFSALCAGASGYLLKNTSPAKVLEAIKEVYEGGAPMSPSIAKKVIESFHPNKPETTLQREFSKLTEKENEVLHYLVKGLSYKLIADKMGLSHGTIHSHLKNIYKKLHVNSMTEAIIKAIAAGKQAF